MSDTRTPEQIERDIEETRAKLAADIEALKARLSPEGLKEEAAHRLEGVASVAAVSAKEAAARLAERAEKAGDTLLERLRATPLPLAEVGAALVLGYALMRGSSQGSERRDGGAVRAYPRTETPSKRQDRSALVAAGVALAGGVAAGWFFSGKRRAQPIAELPPPGETSASADTSTSFTKAATSQGPTASTQRRDASGERRAVEALSHSAVARAEAVDDAPFRQHYETHLAASGRPFDFYAHAYRFGAQLRASDGHDFTRWSAMETYARRAWEGSNQTPWDDVSPAVRYGWEWAASEEKS